MTFNDFIKKIQISIEKYLYIDERYGDGSYGFEIYADYNDKFSMTTMKMFMDYRYRVENVRDMLSEWADDYKWDYGLADIKESIKSQLSDAELSFWEDHECEIDRWFDENICFYYPEDHFNCDVCVNIMLDTGDAKMDFSSNNCLNYWSNYSGKLDEESPIRWLARQQGREKDVDLAIRNVKYENEDGCYAGRKIEDDSFVESVLQELENQCSCMSGLLFMVKMKLFDLLELRQKLEKGIKGNIIVSKNAMCGLFSPWNGGGSILELAPEIDIEIPFEYIWDAWIEGTKQHGYDVDDVYGICSSAWSGNVTICYGE